MSFYADKHSARNALRRVELDYIKDDEGIQRAIVKGYADETIKLAQRGQYFGLSSNPPPGSVGYASLVGGRPDQAMLMGVEHPAHRPTSQQPGDTVLYDANGQFLKLVKGKKLEMETGDQTVKGGKAVWEFDELVIKANKIVLDATCHVGGPGGKPCSLEGTIDTCGCADVTNLASKVYIT